MATLPINFVDASNPSSKPATDPKLNAAYFNELSTQVNTSTNLLSGSGGIAQETTSQAILSKTNEIAASFNQDGKGLRKAAWFRPGTYTFTIPAGVTEISLTAAGAGGSGGGLLGIDAAAAGSGGGGGACIINEKKIVVPLSIYTIIIGTGGSNGTSGAPTIVFGMTLSGGGSGTFIASGITNTLPPNGGLGGGIGGGAGGIGSSNAGRTATSGKNGLGSSGGGSGAYGGGGGGSYGGGGGGSADSSSAELAAGGGTGLGAGGGYGDGNTSGVGGDGSMGGGGGGGKGSSGSSSKGRGGNGGDGMCIIEW